MKQFKIRNLPINGLSMVDGKKNSDNRGFLKRNFCSLELKNILQDRNIIQINHTLTRFNGIIRGLHYQLPPYAEMKMISCLKGEIFDVAVDLRANSNTFLQWHAEILTEKDNKIFVIPEGFAHGFQTLKDNCELLYMHTARYFPNAEAGINAFDNNLSINWPNPSQERSKRDQNLPFIKDSFKGIEL